MLIPILVMIKGIVEPGRKVYLIKDTRRSVPDFIIDAINSTLIEYSNNHKSLVTIEVRDEIPMSVRSSYGQPQLPYDRMPDGTLLVPLYNNTIKAAKPTIKLYITPNGNLLCVLAPARYLNLMKSTDFPDNFPSVDGILNNDLTLPWQNINTPEQIVDSLKSFTAKLSLIDDQLKN